MSVRTEPKDLSAQLQQTLTIPADVMAQAGNPGMVTAPMGPAVEGTGAPVEQALHGANDFNTNSPDHPLSRTVVVNIRSSLSDLTLRGAKAIWAPPNTEATKAIFQQKKFTDLSGAAEHQGDLKSVVLHKMTMNSVQSTFPIALGLRITGVDDATFSQTGESYSTIALPNANSHTARTLQEDNTDLAYEFARKFPGYTAENLSEKGIHEVAARRFCLVAADHPLVSAISENAEKLQMGEISMMPEGLVKTQVESQIKVRDLSSMSVTASPADYASWEAVRNDLMAEAKKGLKARVEAEVAAARDGDDLEAMKVAFQGEERDLEHSIDHEVHTFAAVLDIDYNFLSK